MELDHIGVALPREVDPLPEGRVRALKHPKIWLKRWAGGLSAGTDRGLLGFIWFECRVPKRTWGGRNGTTSVAADRKGKNSHSFRLVLSMFSLSI